VAAFGHTRSDGAAAEIGAEHVHFEDSPPFLERLFEEGATASRDPGVRDEQVDRTELSFRALDPALDVIGTSHVTDETQPRELFGYGVNLLRGASGDRDPHPCSSELSRDRGADPTAASRHERDALEGVRRHG
jgi:hypothetical protein